MRVLIVGNIVKDVYLELDKPDSEYEIDDFGVSWLNLAFDGGSHHYSRRTSVYGGASVTMEVLHKFGVEATISGRKVKEIENGRMLEFKDGKPCEIYRYILTHNNQNLYLTSSERPFTKLSAPNESVDWIFIDRSVHTSPELVKDLEKYLEVSTDTKLAVFASTRGCGCWSEVEMRSAAKPGSKVFSSSDRALIEKAELVFTDGSLFGLKTKGKICEITPDEIRFEGRTERYEVKNNDLITHLTSYSIIAATVLGAVLTDRSIEDALDLAVINVTNASLTGTLSREELDAQLALKKQARANLRLIASTLVSYPKGILAADESGGSIHKKFEAAGIPDDEQHRRDYRNIFFTTDGLSDYVNGVILFEETAHQKADDGTNFVEFLTAQKIIPGIKADQGLEPFIEPGYETEKWTKGLKGLPGRLKEYYNMGARFAKWRAAFEITLVKGGSAEIRTPSKVAIVKNAEILARYAKDCQDAGIVPIVEPEVVHEGDYSIETCAKVTSQILDETFRALKAEDVDLAACILKCNMVLAGSRFKNQSSPEAVGRATAEVLKNHVPSDLAGVVFLSGGQGVEQATNNLAAVIKNGPFDWPVTFSFARALQGPALEAWQGNNENIDAARAAFKERLIANAEALKK